MLFLPNCTSSAKTNLFQLPLDFIANLVEADCQSESFFLSCGIPIFIIRNRKKECEWVLLNKPWFQQWRPPAKHPSWGLAYCPARVLVDFWASANRRYLLASSWPMAIVLGSRSDVLCSRLPRRVQSFPSETTCSIRGDVRRRRMERRLTVILRGSWSQVRHWNFFFFFL